MGIDPDALERFEALEKRLSDMEGRLANLERTSSVDRLNEAVLSAAARSGSAETAIATAIEALEAIK